MAMVLVHSCLVAVGLLLFAVIADSHQTHVYDINHDWNESNEIVVVTSGENVGKVRHMGGRKMVVGGKNFLRKEAANEDQKQQMNIEMEARTEEEEEESAGSLRSPRRSEQEHVIPNTEPAAAANKPASQESKAQPTKPEKQRLLEATKEIVNLIHKDYRGSDRPRRKPPINNHAPLPLH